MKRTILFDFLENFAEDNTRATSATSIALQHPWIKKGEEEKYKAYNETNHDLLQRCDGCRLKYQYSKMFKGLCVFCRRGGKNDGSLHV